MAEPRTIPGEEPNADKAASKRVGGVVRWLRARAKEHAVFGVTGWQAAAAFGPGGKRALHHWGDPRMLLVWDKGDGAGMGDCRVPWKPNWETIAIYGDGWTGRRTTGILRGAVMAQSYQMVQNETAGRHHPHEKHLGVVGELVSKAPPGLPIVDPFMGSGTTAVACALLGREFYGAEIDPQYWDVIRGRLAKVGVMIP